MAGSGKGQKEMDDALEKLFANLNEAGCEAKAVPVGMLPYLKEEIDGLRGEGNVDDAVVKKWFHEYVFDAEEMMKGASSVVVIAMPVKAVKLVFSYRGKKREAVIPPGYTVTEADRSLDRLLERTLLPEGVRYRRLTHRMMPLKLLAVKSGLCEYGRNNIAYSRCLGSYLRLAAVLTDRAAGDFEWRKARRMAGCATCGACRRACPTGAIAERDVIHAEKCLTFYNEDGGDFPEWIPPKAHNALIGCLRCQQVCPVNRGKLEADVRCDPFPPEDIDRLLAGAPYEALTDQTRKTLEALDMAECFDAFSRNFALLLRQDDAV